MIDNTRNQSYIQQTRCDHVFSFLTQDGVHIFKCENCPEEHKFIGNSKSESQEA